MGSTKHLAFLCDKLWAGKRDGLPVQWLFQDAVVIDRAFATIRSPALCTKHKRPQIPLRMRQAPPWVGVAPAPLWPREVSDRPVSYSQERIFGSLRAPPFGDPQQKTD